MDPKITLIKENAFQKANIISKIFGLSACKIFRKGFKIGLFIDDLWKVRKKDNSSELGDKLEKAWDYEISKAMKKGRKPSLTKAIIKVFWVQYIWCGIWIFILFTVIWPMLPYTLSLIVAYFSSEKSAESYKKAHLYTFILNALSLLTSLIMNNLTLYQGCIGMRIRVACCSLMYRKGPWKVSNVNKQTHRATSSLNDSDFTIMQFDFEAKDEVQLVEHITVFLSRLGLSKTEPGQVINLMSNDVSRFDMVIYYLHFIWVTPFVMAVVSYLVWEKIQASIFVCLCVIIVETFVIQAYLGHLQGKFRDQIANRTDERVKVMSELVNGIQVIKMYAWEKPFEKLVVHLRRLEVHSILLTNLVKGFTLAIEVFTERIILFSGITAFVVMGGNISAEITFSLVQYFNLLMMVCNMFLPLGLSFGFETLVSLKRMQEFLLLDEHKPSDKEKHDDSNTYTGIDVNNLSACWGHNVVLNNITFTAGPGEFIGVVGHVGAGKTSLLQVLLGELPTTNGFMSLGKGIVAYANQEPWLFVASIKKNILFGLDYDSNKYNKVVHACALLRDFELMPLGDSTMVGERGISLSGGQRARIALARACYRQADIYLLDDPLSAVDTHVGKHLMSECLLGLLKNSTRILVTHQLHHLKAVDKIIILNNGYIEAQGTYDKVSRSPLFSEIMKEADDLDLDHSPEDPSVRPVLWSAMVIALGSMFVFACIKKRYFHNTSDKRTVTNQELRTRNQASFVMQHTIRSPSIAYQTSTYTLHPTDVTNVPLEDDDEEYLETGRIPCSVYKKYFKAGDKHGLIIWTITFIILAQVVTSTSDLWLTHWMNDVESKGPNTMDHTPYIIFWAVSILGCVIFTSVRSTLFVWLCTRSSENLHNRMFSNVLTATMHFFDTNPSGRILNRFSKDIGIIDELLPRMYLDGIQVMMVMIGILVMVSITNPYMILATALCGLLMYFWTIVFLNSAQAIKRLEGVSRSPVYSHVTASMAGVTTIRALRAEDILKKQFDEKQDIHTSAWFLTLVTNACFAIWLSLMTALYVCIASYAFLFINKTDSGYVGLALSQGLILVNMVQYGIKQITDVISQMTCVERVIQYTDLPQEKTEGFTPPPNWPTNGRIDFVNMYLRYVEHAPPVLKKLNLVIESGWKVGVVGRTGAGKSSLISALFRLGIIHGQEYIDGLDTKDINLQMLRSKISIIPQEPVLFSASLRFNLDPFSNYSDDEIWAALEQVELKKSIETLSMEVAGGGTNFSVGQRQLLCIARAALAKNKLLVLDEATANVDPTTDALIQKAIRKFFGNCTVITVAHRLHTIADSDRVLVMDAGEIAEFDHPHLLLQNANSKFSKMVAELDKSSEKTLREISRKAYAKYKENEVLGEPATDAAILDMNASRTSAPNASATNAHPPDESRSNSASPDAPAPDASSTDTTNSPSPGQPPQS